MNRLSLTLGVAAMDTCWLAAWAVLAGWWTDLAHPRALLSAASIFGLLLVAALSTQLGGRQAALRRTSRAALVGLGLALVLLVVRLEQYPARGGFDWLELIVGALAVVIGQTSAPALAFGLGLLIWWRGVGLGSQRLTFPDVESAFRRGIALLVVFGLVVGVTTRPSQLPALEAETTLFVVAFFFFSLVSLALGRLESLRTRTRVLAINSQWLGVLLGLAGVVVLLALIVGQLLSFDVLFLATRPLFELLARVLVVAIYVVVIPLAYLVELLIYALLSLLRPGDNQRQPEPPQPADVDNLLSRLLSQAISPELAVALKAIGAGLLVALALVVVARTIGRWRPSSTDADATAEERESVWQATSLRELWRAWLRRLFRRSKVSGALAAAAMQVTVAPADDGPETVRELYRAVLRMGEAAGASRSPSTTPLEHQPALANALAADTPVAEVTGAYVEVRYAEAEPPPPRVALLRGRLDAVRQLAGHLTGAGPNRAP